MQRRHQVENLEKDLEEKMATYDTSQQEIERLETEKEKLSISLSKATEMPGKLM
jgi:predicted nuclease with TOPRIM domain